MEQQPRGRGRARGRARGTPSTGAVPKPGVQPGQQTTAPRGAPVAPGPSTAAPPAWGPRSQVQQQLQFRAPTPAVQPAHFGRATFRKTGDKIPGVEEVAGAIVGPGGDTAFSHNARGTMRGRRTITEVATYFRTKPDAITSKQGNFGNTIKLKANYFRLEQMTDWSLYQSRVDFSPEEDSTPVRKRLLRTALKEILPVYVFDGTVLYASTRLHPDPFEVFVDPEVDGAPKVRITIRTVGQLGEGDYHFLQFFNIIMRKCMGFLKLQLVGRNFFDAVAKISMPNIKMELWPGYVTSIRQHEKHILMCCEITTKCMRNDTVLSLLKESMEEDRHGFQKLFQNKVIGTIVLTDYNNRTYHIDDIDWKSTVASEFSRKDGSKISYERYFKERYGLNIRDKKQPMLVSNAKSRELRAGMPEHIYLVPELCRLTGLSDSQRANFSLMRSLAEHTRLNPEARITKLRKFSTRLQENPQIMTELRNWNLKLATDLVEFEARVLPPETVVCGQNGTYSAGRDVNWTKEVRGKPMFEEGKCPEWIIIAPERMKQSVDKFSQCINKCASGMRWNIGRARTYFLKDDRVGGYLEMLEYVFSKHDPSLLMCVVPNNKSDRYSAIKKKCCVDRAVPTQVVVAKSLESRDTMSIATKVAIQMNCKLGGAPWTLQIPVQGIMICGFDVCHDPHDKTKSYGALVCSLNKQITRYYSTVSAHTAGEEISTQFAYNMVKGCLAWKEIQGRLPEKIIIYRDGVGDGQIPYIKEHEVETTKKVLKDQLYKDAPVKLCFIIVSKRINTRFFLQNENPPPGTVVDSVVTLPERYDFFIVSQCVRQGTVAPTSYNVIDDNMGLAPDHLQRLTYKLTHMYFNWSGTVRVPAPCQYAHKLAFLVSQNLRRSPHDGLRTLLYFL